MYQKAIAERGKKMTGVKCSDSKEIIVLVAMINAPGSKMPPLSISRDGYEEFEKQVVDVMDVLETLSQKVAAQS